MDGSSPQLDLRTGDLGVRHRGRAAILACAQDAADRRRVARLGAARRSRDERRAHVRRAACASFPFDGGRGRVPRDGRRRGRRSSRSSAIGRWPRISNGTVEFVNARFAARGSGRVLGNRTADLRVGIGDLRAGDFTLQRDTIGGLDQVLAFLNACAVDRALPRRGLRAARSAGRHRRREPRPDAAAAQPRSVSS